METCFESVLTESSAGAISGRMSPISRVIDSACGGRDDLVIVLGAHANTSGVSVLTERPPAGGGCPPGW